MDLNLNIYGVTLVVSGLAILILTFFIFQKDGPVSNWFVMVKLAISTWAIAYGFELMQSALAGMLFWIKIEYIGIGLLPACWIIFIFHYLDKGSWLTPINLFLIFLIPVTTLLMVWTNSWHHLHYRHVALDTTGPFALLAITPGIWYRIHTVFFYLMMGWGTVLIITAYHKSERLYKYQNLSILLGALIPWVINIIYLSGLRPYHHIDLTPYGFIATALFISFGLIKFKLFDIVPMARGKALEIMHEGIVILDKQYRIVDFNDMMQELLGSGKKDIIGRDFFQLWPDQNIMKAIEDNRCSKVKIEKSFNNGKTNFEISINPFGRLKGERHGTLLLFWDITKHTVDALRMSEQASKLEELNILKDKLLSIIAHDLRSPLTNIKQMVEMIESGMITEKELKFLIPRLSKNVQYTSELLENLLYWSKSQLKGLDIQFDTFNIETIIRNNIALAETTAANKKISIKADLKIQLIVYADKSMVDLVLRNLMSNAVKFSLEQSEIVVGAKYVEDEVIVYVEDQGVGMTHDVIERLFTNDNQSTVGTQNEKGAGLGLMICRDFIAKNGGMIWAESEVGKGSTFYFTLPKVRNSLLV